MLDYTWKQKKHIRRFRGTELLKGYFHPESGHVGYVVDTVALG
jgi:hypothetical protein